MLLQHYGAVESGLTLIFPANSAAYLGELCG